MFKGHFARFAFAPCVCAAITISLLAALPAHAQTPTVVYAFQGQPGPENPNDQALTLGRDGQLYLWTPGGDGGALNCTVTYCGGLFKISTTGTVTDLFDQSNNECSVVYCGNGTYGGLILGSDGNFYGATRYGGTTGNNGTIFKMTATGTVTPLYNFTGGSDGSHPNASPIQGTNGIFYGTTDSESNNSTAYSITSSGTFTTLHTFTGTDGQAIYAPLVQGTDGNFYGTASAGGTNNDGVIFKMTPSGTVTLLHNFAGTDGSTPYYPLIQASDGNFYGVAYSGGTSNAGVIFKITSNGTYTVLYNLNGTTDGTGPAYSLVQATDGKLYGVTAYAPNGYHITGTIFSITTSGTFTTLYTFTNGTDGGYPLTPMLQHTNGLLYGTTDVGGGGNCSTNIWNVQQGGCGEVFSLNIGANPFIKLSSASGKVGSQVGIFGQGFSSSSVVKFNGVQATKVTRTGATYMSATVPTAAASGFVTVTTGTTTLTSSKKYTVHNSWASGAAMPTAVNWPAAGVIGSKAYVVGGYTGGPASTTNQIYNFATNKWSTGAALPVAMGQASAAVVSNILYVFGGSNNGGGTVFNTVWAYNPTTNSWSSKTAMPTARCSAAAVVASGIIYVIGGYNGGNRLNTVEAYNPATDSWTAKASLIEGKTEISAGLIGTTIVAADGFTSGADNGDNEAYSISANSWSSLAADPTARNGSCAGVISSLLYASDGNDNSNNPVSLMESFSLTQNKWTPLLAMPQPATDMGSAVYGGQLYCFGGGNNAVPPNNTVYNYVQIYQP